MNTDLLGPALEDASACVKTVDDIAADIQNCFAFGG
jgi:hypothetical protein